MRRRNTEPRTKTVLSCVCDKYFLGCTKYTCCTNKSYFYAVYKMAEFVFHVKCFSSLENGRVEVYEVNKAEIVDFAILLVKR